MSNLVDPNTLTNSFWEGMDKSDFAVPRVKVGQKEQAAGKFVYNSGEALSEIANCKLLVPTKTRVLYNGNGRARCKSDNFHTPSPFVQNPINNSCLHCPLAQWGDDPRKEQVALEIGENDLDFNKPMCKETYNLMMVDGEGKPFIISFQGTNLKVVSEKLLSRLKYQKLPPFHVAFDMKTIRLQNGNRVYYNVAFDNFREADNKEMMTELYQTYKQQAQTIVAQQHEDMDKAHDAQASPKDVGPTAPNFESNEEIPF